MRDKPTILFVRFLGGLGDLLCSLPAVKRYKEMGWRTLYYWPNSWIDWAALCPHIDIIVPALLKDTPMDDEYNMCPLEPDPAQWFTDMLHNARMPESIAAGVDKIANLSWPCRNIEHASLESWCMPVLSRVEIFWCAAGLDLVDLPPDPMPGCLAPDTGEEIKGEYAVVQAHAAEPALKPFPPPLIWPTIQERRSRGDFQEVIVVGKDEMSCRYWSEYDVSFLYGVPPRYLCNLISGAEVVFTPDSAFLHLAAITGTPCESWFGATSGSITCRRYPLAKYHQFPGCSPCYWSIWQKKECRERGMCLITDKEEGE